MRKINLALAVLLVLSSNAASAETDFQGWRIGAGVGFNETDVDRLDGGSIDYEGFETFTIEGGYDINRFLGLKFSVSGGGLEGNRQSDAGGLEGVKSDVRSFNGGVDLGYTFELRDAHVKPYVEAGGFFSNLNGYEYNDNNGDEAIDGDHNYNVGGYYYGVGVRTTFKSGIYADVGYTVNSGINDTASGVTVDSQQTRLTVGYKF